MSTQWMERNHWLENIVFVSLFALNNHLCVMSSSVAKIEKYRLTKPTDKQPWYSFGRAGCLRRPWMMLRQMLTQRVENLCLSGSSVRRLREHFCRATASLSPTLVSGRISTLTWRIRYHAVSSQNKISFWCPPGPPTPDTLGPKQFTNMHTWKSNHWFLSEGRAWEWCNGDMFIV